MAKRIGYSQGGSLSAARGHQTAQDEELRRLKRELEITKQERDVLKKAIGIFSRNQQ
jgi:transposase